MEFTNEELVNLFNLATAAVANLQRKLQQAIAENNARAAPPAPPAQPHEEVPDARQA